MSGALFPWERAEPPVSTHPAALDDEALLAACEMGRERSGGPGGQNRNKVETKVVLAHRETGVSAQAGERRSVRENRRVALFRLRLALATEVRHPVPDGDARTALWRRRCRGGKVVCNPEHRDYPALLAEAMDNLSSCGHEPRAASKRLLCTPTQLVRLLRQHPAALERLNRDRREAGLRALK